MDMQFDNVSIEMHINSQSKDLFERNKKRDFNSIFFFLTDA